MLFHACWNGNCWNGKLRTMPSHNRDKVMLSSVSTSWLYQNSYIIVRRETVKPYLLISLKSLYHYRLPQSFTLNGCMSESQRQLHN